jgi:ribosomal protein S3AE
MCGPGANTMRRWLFPGARADSHLRRQFAIQATRVSRRRVDAATAKLRRWAILHIIQEMARHAGLADIIRESIDGATMYELLAALAILCR